MASESDQLLAMHNELVGAVNANATALQGHQQKFNDLLPVIGTLLTLIVEKGLVTRDELQRRLSVDQARLEQIMAERRGAETK
jgi:indole-3-glycerol phosphate synthase